MAVVDKLNFIIQQYEKNKLSHAFLIETNNIDYCLNDVKEIVKIINKSEDNENLNNLIDMNNLPSLVIIKPDGMSIKKTQMIELEDRFSKKAVYSKYNTYIILNADKMNDSASNSILKFLEEPEDNIIGFLIVNNKENVLPTIRSRCEIIHVDYDFEQEYDEEIVKTAADYIKAIEEKSSYLVNKDIVLSKYSERIDIERIFNVLFNKYYLLYKTNLNNIELLNKYKKIIEIIQNKLNLIQYNVNLDLILDSFVIEMRQVI